MMTRPIARCLLAQFYTRVARNWPLMALMQFRYTYMERERAWDYLAV